MEDFVKLWVSPELHGGGSASSLEAEWPWLVRLRCSVQHRAYWASLPGGAILIQSLRFPSSFEFQRPRLVEPPVLSPLFFAW